MTFEISTKLPNKFENRVLGVLKETSEKEFFLSPRTFAELKNAYKDKNIYFAWSEKQLVGWVMVIKYSENLQEVCFAYVFPKYRKKGLFKKLLNEVLSKSKKSLVVTFSKDLHLYLIKKHGFRHSSLLEVLIMSNGKFFIKRLNINKIKEIFKRFKKTRAYYSIYKY